MINNFIWKYIDINSSIIQELKSRYLKILPNNDHFFQSLDIGINEFLGMKLQRAVLIQVAPGALGRIHTDWRFDKDYGDKLALNIPLMNCENSVTEMWESDYVPPTQYTENMQPYNYYDIDRCKKIAEFKLIKPVLFRTDIPHSVNNTGKTVRRAISLRFKKDPWHLVNNDYE